MFLADKRIAFDPLGRPTDPAGSDNYFRTDFRPSPLFKISQNKRHVKIMITTGGTVGLAEGIIGDTCLVVFTSKPFYFVLYVNVCVNPQADHKSTLLK